MSKTLEDIRKISGFYVGCAGRDAVAYTMPQLWSTQMPIGLVGVMSNDQGADKLVEGMDNLRRIVYTSPMQVMNDLRSDDPAANLKASRFLNGEFTHRFPGKSFYMLYFVGSEGPNQELYPIPSSVVLASGHNPEAFTHDVLLYLAGRPTVAISTQRDKDGYVEITRARDLLNLNRALRSRYQGPLSAVGIPVSGHQSGLIIPASGTRLRKKSKLEVSVQKP
ncbi:hypothetical protein HY487_00265 [Candidatus Woesearchaeota archaeon]|nr:hypothetical protein [Candidatus Woesearchaeota archaeon]